MCYNLIENAIKYSGNEAIVHIHLTAKDKEVVLRVADNGIGITDEEKQKIFSKFYRIGNEQTRQHKGTGLGLYIVRSVVKLHKGHLSISDNSPKGSVFEVVLFSHN
jgi:two-component system, OmpR family, phosphate regulon sensor histidine kinase PhoR